MKEYLGYCRYGQYGCDYVVIQCNDDLMDETIKDLIHDMSGGDVDALEYAQPKLDELENNGIINIIKLHTNEKP